MALAVLIMAGGSGTRLWPISRPDRPKQFARVIDGATLFEQTYARVRRSLPDAEIFVNVTAGQEAWVRRLAPAIPAERVIGVPADRDTLPTLGYATLAIERQLRDPTLLILASDNWMAEEPSPRRIFEEAIDAAERGPHLVSIGIRPTHPSTQYGYMHVGARAPFGSHTYFGLGYHEKPSSEIASRFVDSGVHDWNSGMFAWTAKTFWGAVRQHAPECAGIFEQMRNSAGSQAPDACDRLFQRLPKQAVDRVILEKVRADSPQPHVFVRAELAWDDLGHYAALGPRLPCDPSGNRVRGAVAATDSQGCLLITDERRSLTVDGLRDLLVVQDDGHLLVANLASLARLRELGEVDLWPGPSRNDAQSPAVNAVRGFVKTVRATGCRVDSDSDGIVALFEVTDLSVEFDEHGIRIRALPASQRSGTPTRSSPPGPAHGLRWTVADDEMRMSELAAAHVVESLGRELGNGRRPLVIFSAGRTPLKLMALLRSRFAEALDWSRVRLAQMDEWSEVPKPKRFAEFLRAQLVEPLGIGEFLPIESHWSQPELSEYERTLTRRGLDLVVHGIGCNGHLGFNEPDSDFDAPARIVALAPTTRIRAAGEFDGLARVPHRGLTLGLGALNSAREVVVIASSVAPSPAGQQMLYGPVCRSLPASSLQLHADASVYLDRAAASSWLRRAPA